MRPHVENGWPAWGRGLTAIGALLAALLGPMTGTAQTSTYEDEPLIVHPRGLHDSIAVRINPGTREVVGYSCVLAGRPNALASFADALDDETAPATWRLRDAVRDLEEFHFQGHHRLAGVTGRAGTSARAASTPATLPSAEDRRREPGVQSGDGPSPITEA
jgi:hypothetical protein